MTIDVHTHILPETWPDLREKYGCDGWVSIERCDECSAKLFKDGAHFRTVRRNCWCPETRLEECAAAGVATQALSTTPVMFSYWAPVSAALDLSRTLNDHIAEIVQAHPTGFVGLGTVPMQAPDVAAKELERCVKELGLLGVEIGSHVEPDADSGRTRDWNLDDEALSEFFAAAESLGAAVFVHPWDMMGAADMPRHWLPWLVGMPAETSRAICSMIMGGVFGRFPRLRTLFAHGGGSFPGTIGRIEHGRDVRPDLCAQGSELGPRSALGRFWVDSLVHDSEALRMIVALFGEDRVAMGSDYPFPLGEHEPGKLIRESGFGEATKRRLLSENAREFLGLEAR